MATNHAIDSRKKLLQILVSLVVLLFIIRYFSHFDLKFDIVDFNMRTYLLLALALIIQISSIFCSMFIWQKIASCFHINCPSYVHRRNYFISRVIRYVPGKVWQYLGRARLYKRYNIAGINVTSGMMIEFISIIFSSGFLSGLLLFYLPNGAIASLWVYILICVSLATLVVTKPHILNDLIVFLAKKFDRELIKPVLGTKEWIEIILVYCIAWILKGFSLIVLCQIVAHVTLSQIPLVVSILSFSWLIGYLSFFAPNGLGVREGVLTYLLINLGGIAPAAALLLSIGSRLIGSIAEIVLGLVGYLGIVMDKAQRHLPTEPTPLSKPTDLVVYKSKN